MPSRPNVLILFTDMQRADTIRALGNPVIKTPHLDRLVREGVAFSNAFSPSPVCMAARCCMQYGLYPQKTGLYENGPMMDDNGKSFPALLGSAGYRAHAVGKCHFSPSESLRGFQSRLTQEENLSHPEYDDYCKYLADNGYDYIEPQGMRSEMYYIPQVSHLPAKAHSTQWVGDRSIDFITEASSSDQPWCLFSSYIHPHPPFTPPKPWHKLYRASDMPLPKVPPNSEALYTHINLSQNRYKYRDRGIDQNLLRTIKAFYYATISFVDYQVGRIIATLEANGQLDNTLIIFSSDHGEYLGDYNCFGKRSMHDASSRIPLLVRYPERFARGKICDTPVSLVDVLPTCANAAGIDTSDVDLDGMDLSELAKGSTDRQYVYSQWSKGPAAIYMIVSKEWKYFYSAGDQAEFLFDKTGDPQEQTNVAASCPEARDTMKSQLLDFLKLNNSTNAFTQDNGRLDWKQYPLVDKSYLDDPDAALLRQDAPGSIVEIEGYS